MKNVFLDALVVRHRQTCTLNAFESRVDDSGMTFAQLDALSDWLVTQQWSYFGTITTKHELTPRGARRLMSNWLDAIEHYFGDIKAFWVAEEFGLRRKPGVHIHFVVQVPPNWCMQQKPKYEAAWNGTTEARNLYGWAIMHDTARRLAGGESWRNKSGKTGRWHRIDLQPYNGTAAGVKYCMKYLTKGFVEWDYYCTLEGVLGGVGSRGDRTK